MKPALLIIDMQNICIGCITFDVWMGEDEVRIL